MDQQLLQLKTDERIDRLGYHGLQIIQNPDKFKFTMDAFLLASFIDPRPLHKILDIGSGGGVLSLLIAGQREVAKVEGIEIQPELGDMSRRSVILNGLEQKINIEVGDLKDLPAPFSDNSFDYVITNPPFFEKDRGMVSENLSLARAKFEIDCTLEDVVAAAAKCVKGNGKVAIIYPAERLNDLMAIFNKRHLMPKRICFIHPKPGEKSNLVLMEARPGAKKGVEVLSPVTIYRSEGVYTDMMEKIFHGLSLREILAQ